MFRKRIAVHHIPTRRRSRSDRREAARPASAPPPAAGARAAGRASSPGSVVGRRCSSSPRRSPLAALVVAGWSAGTSGWQPAVVAAGRDGAARGGRRLGRRRGRRARPRPGRHDAAAAVAAARAASSSRPTCRQHRSGELAVLATRGVAAVEPYLTRYLPALVAGGVLPVLTLLGDRVARTWLSALIVLLHAAAGAGLRGARSARRPATARDRQWRALAALVRPLPRRRARAADAGRLPPRDRAGRRASAAVTDRYRRATLRHAAARVRVVGGARAGRHAVGRAGRGGASGCGWPRAASTCRTALIVLLLAPEAYWPLRRVGAEFHAAAEGTATFEAVHALTATAHARRPAGAQPVRDPASRRCRPDRDLARPHRRPPSRPRRDDPRARADRGRRALRLRQVHAARRAARRPARPPGSIEVGGDRRSTPLDLDAWRDPRRLRARSGRGCSTAPSPTTSASAGPSASLDEVARWPWRPCGLGDLVTGHRARRGRRRPLRRAARPARAGPGRRVPTVRYVAARRADRAPRRGDRAGAARASSATWLATGCVVAVAHRPALLAEADHGHRPARAPAARAPRSLVAAPVRDPHGHAPAFDEPDVPTRVGFGFAGVTALGVLAASAGVALTATAGWLITRASEHPPVLLLMVAIVGVRTFGLARPVLRYAERLVSHDVALRLLAERRARGLRRWSSRSCPGGSADAAATCSPRVVDDVDALPRRAAARAAARPASGSAPPR